MAKSVILRNRSLAILVGGQGVSQVGNAMNGMAISWLVLNLTHSRADLGLVSAVGSAVGMAMLVSGVYVDRWNRRRTLIVADIIRGVLMGLLVALAVIHALSVVEVIGLVIISGLVSTVFGPASIAFLQQIVDSTDIPSANGVYSVVSTTSTLLGTPIGGWIISVLGPVAVFGLNGLSFLVSVVTLRWIRAPQPPVRTEEPPDPTRREFQRFWPQLVEGWDLIWHHVFLRRIVLAGMISGFGSGSLMAFEVVWVRQVLHLGAFYFGVFGLVFAGGNLIAGTLFGTLATRIAIPRLTVITLLGSGLLIIIFSQIPFLWPDLLIYLVLGTFSGLLSMGISVFLQQSVPSELLGRSFGTLAALTNGMMPLSAVLTGLVSSVVSMSTVFFGAGAIIALATTMFFGLPDTTTEKQQSAG